MARCFFRNSIGPFVLLGRVMYNKKTIQKGGSRLDKRMYLSIDLKSFYASVECLEHGLDPMTTNLVVADAGCTEKTICLAISPSLKSCGIPGRARLFKVKQPTRSGSDLGTVPCQLWNCRRIQSSRCSFRAHGQPYISRCWAQCLAA